MPRQRVSSLRCSALDISLKAESTARGFWIAPRFGLDGEVVDGELLSVMPLAPLVFPGVRPMLTSASSPSPPTPALARASTPREPRALALTPASTLRPPPTEAEASEPTPRALPADARAPAFRPLRPSADTPALIPSRPPTEAPISSAGTLTGQARIVARRLTLTNVRTIFPPFGPDARYIRPTTRVARCSWPKGERHELG